MSTKALAKPISSLSLFDDFLKPWNEWFHNGAFPAKTATMPSVNIIENGNHYTLSLAAPGMKKNDFQIDLEGNILTISSEKEEKTEEKDEKYTRKEYSYSSFSRSFTLPDDVKQDAVDARYEDGVLKIKLPRLESSQKAIASKKIEIK